MQSADEYVVRLMAPPETAWRRKPPEGQKLTSIIFTHARAAWMPLLSGRSGNIQADHTASYRRGQARRQVSTNKRPSGQKRIGEKMTTTTETKSIRIVCTRPRREKIVEVSSDDTASAVMEKAGLNPNDYILMKSGDEDEFNLGDQVHGEVSSGGKLHVVPQSDVGV